MSSHGKKYLNAKTKVENKLYAASDALKKIKELAYAKFDETVDVNINVSIDPTKGDQVVRGSVVLPHSIGKEVKIVVFAKGDYVDLAKKAGADYVGAEDLIEKIEGGWLDFNYAIATPDLMGLVGKVAKILGPKGLVPNKKTGTVTFEVDKVVADLKKGRHFFKSDKSGIVHFSIGKVSFDEQKLLDNLKAFSVALAASKPPVSKGKFIKKMTVSSTMGVGIGLNSDEINQ